MTSDREQTVVDIVVNQNIHFTSTKFHSFLLVSLECMQRLMQCSLLSRLILGHTPPLIRVLRTAYLSASAEGRVEELHFHIPEDTDVSITTDNESVLVSKTLATHTLIIQNIPEQQIVRIGEGIHSTANWAYTGINRIHT